MSDISLSNQLAEVTGLTNDIIIKVNPSRDDDTPVNIKFVNILRLAQKLEAAKIPYDLHRILDGWQLCFTHGDHCADLVEHTYSYGSNMDLMESMGFEDDCEDVSGYLTIEDCMEKISNFFGW